MESSFPTPALETTTSYTRLAPELVRRLLRKLRDLDLRAARLELSGGRRARLGGCLSTDSPVESSLRYLVHVHGETDRVLEIALGDHRLEVDARREDTGDSERHLSLEVLSDHQGRATIPVIQARVHPDSTDPREIEHFLRRLVRASLRRS